MDKSRIKTLLSNLNSTSTTKVTDSLNQIRTSIIKTENGLRSFRECGGLENLVPLLRKTNENVLDVVLSTLGNCCMEEESSLAVGKLKITSHLITILKCISRDSIVGRTCRLIGNLAQQSVNAEQLHSEGAVAALITIIGNSEKTFTYQTLTMAVRAIRLLWMVTEFREDMLAIGAVRAVAVLLATECENCDLVKPLSGDSKRQKKEIISKKSRDELFAGLLKCLGFFTTLSTFQCAEQIQGDGRGYRCLVILTRNFESSAAKCIVNLCYVSTSRPSLGTAGAVECLVDLLNTNLDWPEPWIRGLCLLSREAVNRAKLRECGGLSLLLAVARDSAAIARHTHSLHALLQFVFDDIGFQILINEGLIGIIEEQLTEYITTMKCEHQQKTIEEQCKSEPTKGDNHTQENKIKINTDNSSSKNTISKPINDKNKLKIVIERDNMIIGFNDSYDVSDCDDSEDEYKIKTPGSARKRCRKIAATEISKSLSLQKMARYDWSSCGISCEPKGPDWTYATPSPNLSPISGYSPTSNYSKSPKYEVRPGNNGFKYHGVNSNRRGLSSLDTKSDWSPESTSSLGIDGACSSSTYYSRWSPGSAQSLCYSPHSVTNYDEDSSDSEKSGRYSPVCSDIEENPQTKPSTTDNMSEFNECQMANDLDDLMMDDETFSVQELQLEDTTEQQSRSYRATCLLVLLSRVSHSDTGVERLVSRDLLHSLISYVQKSKYPLNRAARILARIISNATHLVKLLKHRLILHLYKMLHEPKHLECRQCKQLNILSTRLLAQLTMLAESDYGIGEISYQLLKGEDTMKQTLALTLPYIIRSQRPLKKFLTTCKALELIFSLLTDFKEPLEYCVPTLSQLASSLHLKDPKTLEVKFKDHIILGYDPAFEGVSPDDIVNFILDDSSSVLANRQFLCQQSEVFNAMFTGAFKESSEKSVRLKKVTKDGLEYLLTLLHCGINNESASIETFPLPKCLATALETLLLADRFLMEKLKGLLFSSIVQFKLEPSSADEIYIWSLEEGMGLLCVESVAYILAGQMNHKQRLKVFTSIMDTSYRQQLIDDIRNILIRHFK